MAEARGEEKHDVLALIKLRRRAARLSSLPGRTNRMRWASFLLFNALGGIV